MSILILGVKSLLHMHHVIKYLLQDLLYKGYGYYYPYYWCWLFPSLLPHVIILLQNLAFHKFKNINGTLLPETIICTNVKKLLPNRIPAVENEYSIIEGFWSHFKLFILVWSGAEGREVVSYL